MAANAEEWKLWSTTTIAERTDYTRRYVEENIVAHPDFPAPIRILENGKPRWLASEVIAFLESRRAA
jgi:predicted DNA-binding transcriptional regulator AlpA